MSTVECPLSKGKNIRSMIFPFSDSCHRLKRALERVDAGPGGKNKVYWTSLREVNLNNVRIPSIQTMFSGTRYLCRRTSACTKIG